MRITTRSEFYQFGSRCPAGTIGGVAALLVVATSVVAQTPAKPGSEEFGLSRKQLVQHIEQVELLIAKCMRSQGFKYVPADYRTVRKGMGADKKLPGMSEEDFVSEYGFGLSTTYTGKPPQLAMGYSPAKVGLGEQNVKIFENLLPSDQVAYNRALLGENMDVTFAVGLEIENFSRTGGCTRAAIEQVFEPNDLKATYYNPKDAMINKDPRMKAALREYVSEMREKGFNYNHPDEVEADIRDRLGKLTEGGTIALSEMTADQLSALKELQEYERRVAVADFELTEELIDPVEDAIEREMFPRDIK